VTSELDEKNYTNSLRCNKQKLQDTTHQQLLHIASFLLDKSCVLELYQTQLVSLFVAVLRKYNFAISQLSVQVDKKKLRHTIRILKCGTDVFWSSCGHSSAKRKIKPHHGGYKASPSDTVYHTINVQLSFSASAHVSPLPATTTYSTEQCGFGHKISRNVTLIEIRLTTVLAFWNARGCACITSNITARNMVVDGPHRGWHIKSHHSQKRGC